MEKRIHLLTTYLGYFLIFLFAVRCFDEFQPLHSRTDWVQDVETEREGGNFWYYIHTQSGMKFSTTKEIVKILNPGDSMVVYNSAIFNETTAWSVFSKNTGQMVSKGWLYRPLSVNIILDIIVVILCGFSLFVAYRFELKVVSIFFAIIAAALRWWFIPLS